MFSDVIINQQFSKFLNKNEKLIFRIFELLKQYKKGIPNTYKYSDKYPPKRSNYKYTDKLYIACILYITLNNSSWTSFIGPIEGKQVHKRFREYCKMKLFKKLFNALIENYLSDIESDFLLTDTSNAYNKQCIELGKGNPYHKNKKSVKISAVTDIKGIPLNISVHEGNKHDTKCFKDDIIKDMSKRILNNRLKRYDKTITLIADKGYDAKIIRELLKKRKVISLIKPNNRNTKDENKKRKLTEAQELIYKKRVRIEHFFSRLKKYPKTNCVYERYINSYENLLLLISSKIITENLNK